MLRGDSSHEATGLPSAGIGFAFRAFRGTGIGFASEASGKAFCRDRLCIVSFHFRYIGGETKRNGMLRLKTVPVCLRRRCFASFSAHGKLLTCLCLAV